MKSVSSICLKGGEEGGQTVQGQGLESLAIKEQDWQTQGLISVFK